MKHTRTRIIVALGALLLVLSLLACGESTSTTTTSSSSSTAALSPPPAATTTPAAAKPDLVLSLSGNGSKQSAPFTVGAHWRIAWTCDPHSFQNVAYNVIVSVYSASDATLIALAINATCKTGSTSGTSDQYGAGTYYLSLVSEGDWHIRVTTV